jgi:signal peptidase I
MPPNAMRTLLKVVFWFVVVAGFIGVVLYETLFDVWVVPADDPMMSASIAPTLAPGDVLVLSREGAIGYGNLLRCADPQASGRYVVARALGHSGDKVGIQDETVNVDGKRTPSPHSCDVIQRTLHDPSTNDDVDLVCTVEDVHSTEFEALRAASPASFPSRPTAVTVEPGRWFLVSDDRHIHVDSRDYGSVDPHSCKHIVFRIMGASGLGDSQSRFSIIW